MTFYVALGMWGLPLPVWLDAGKKNMGYDPTDLVQKITLAL